MTYSSAVWDWVAVLSGLRSGEGLFLPLYWRIPARALVWTGWVPQPAHVLTALIVFLLALCVLYFWRRKTGYMVAACALWGLLLADTPFVIVLPPLVWLAWLVVVRFERRFLHKDCSALFSAPIGVFVYAALGTMVVAAGLNVWQCEFAYLPGYFRRARAALFRDGGWHPRTSAAMDRLLNDYVAELVRESEGRRWIFTDGMCDAGIELASKGTLTTIPLAGNSESGAAAWIGRGLSRIEDQLALESGAAGLLRAWTLDRPENLSNAVFQCGFAFLERAASDKLAPCGLVMRTKGHAVLEESAAANLRALAVRIVAFYETDKFVPDQGGHLRKARFCAMQWRVARALRRHAHALDRRNLVQEALAENELTDRLDRLNPMAKRSDLSTESADLRAFAQLTPREWLAFALSRANFTLARNYAQQILKDEPGNAEANFAMAMNCFAEKDYAQARHFFVAALRSRPDDAALLNNLAATELELGEFDAAEVHARAALKAKPESESIKNTLRSIRERRMR